ncbi:hypothetical protein [Methanobacterium sp. SMA-27]|uniref:hypothetical protein n=1 Tax=Methanobacterium sp. SMA-27 TaxID=1495336 RepID=UPI0006935D5C|nr:hypothetical protein [Methanobacterium sp. SMA-27]
MQQNDSKKTRISDNPSHVKIRKQIEDAKNLINFLDNLGIDTTILSKEYLKLEELSKIVIYDIHDRFNDHFSEKGWIAYESMNQTKIIKAVEFADANKFEEAERLLIEYYDENILKLFISRLSFIDVFKPRVVLIEKAFEDHLEERYHATIPVILAMIDGVVSDLKPGDQRGFFAEGADVEAWDAIAAHESGLNALQKVMSKVRKKTQTEKITLPLRNGIIHGRDLGYANKTVAVKVWHTLFALADGIRSMKDEEQRKSTSNDTSEEMPEKTFYENMAKIESFKPRKLDIDYIKSLDYDEETPEKVLVEFLDYWSKDKPNFYEMTKKIDLEERNLKQMVGILRKKVFENKRLTGYEILAIKDETIGVTNIEVNLNFKDENGEISPNTTFKLWYIDSKGKLNIRGTKGCSWKILTGYGIENVFNE